MPTSTRLNNIPATSGILVSLILAYMPHITRMPFWISAFCLGSWILLLIANLRGWKNPTRLYRYLLVIFALFLFILFTGHSPDTRAGIALLSLMLAIKPLEINTKRDQVFTLFLGLFLLFTAVLFSQSLLTGLYLFFVYWLFLVSLFSIQKHGMTIISMFSRSGIILLQTIPLATILFFVFPRLPGSLVGFAEQSSSAVSGLSKTMNPGSISNLAQSSRIAFRVDFKDSPPSKSKRYWRVLILRKYNGNIWEQGKSHAKAWARLTDKEDPSDYSLIMEPSRNKFIPALDMPVSNPPESKKLPGFVLRSEKEINQKIKYKMNSTLSYLVSEIDPKQKKYLLQTNPDKNPKTTELCAKLSRDTSSKKELVAKIMNYFRSEPFSYTLNPKTLDKTNSIDDFLFRTREGFCEHYAQAAAWMLRKLGIPSRIVLGYQGGEMNPLGDYLIVRDSNAHAWVEGWINTDGWIRIDPTKMVAPQRIESGLAATELTPDSSEFWEQSGLNWIKTPWYQAKLFWDTLNYKWYTWVVDYSASKQTELFSSLTPGETFREILRNIFIAALGIILLFFFTLTYLLIRPKNPTEDKALKIFLKYQNKLRKLGLAVYPNEGPNDLAARAIDTFPQLREQIVNINRMYIQLRYAEKMSTAKLNEFKKAVQKFPGKRLIRIQKHQGENT